MVLMGKKKEKNLEIGSLVPIYAQFAEHLRVLMSEQRFVRGLSVDCLGLLNIPVDGLDAYIKSRQEQGKGLLSVEDLSCLLGMSSQSLRKILNAPMDNPIAVSLSTVLKVSRVFGASVDWLLGLTDCERIEVKAEYGSFERLGFSFEAFDNLRKLSKMVEIKEYMKGIDKVLCYSVDSISDSIPFSYSYRLSLPIVEALYNYLVLPYESSYIRVPVKDMKGLMSKVDEFCLNCERLGGNVFESPSMLIQELLDEKAEKEDSVYVENKRKNALMLFLEDCKAKNRCKGLTVEK